MSILIADFICGFILHCCRIWRFCDAKPTCPASLATSSASPAGRTRRWSVRVSPFSHCSPGPSRAYHSLFFYLFIRSLWIPRFVCMWSCSRVEKVLCVTIRYDLLLERIKNFRVPSSVPFCYLCKIGHSFFDFLIFSTRFIYISSFVSMTWII